MSSVPLLPGFQFRCYPITLINFQVLCMCPHSSFFVILLSSFVLPVAFRTLDIYPDGHSLPSLCMVQVYISFFTNCFVFVLLSVPEQAVISSPINKTITAIKNIFFIIDFFNFKCCFVETVFFIINTGFKLLTILVQLL